jgi:hypothetical protein
MARLPRCSLWLILAAGGVAAFAQSQPATRPARVSATDGDGPPGTYWLRVTGEHVNLRSRADKNSVAVAQVDRDAVLQATADEFGWHKIRPPEGCFSYVAAEFVDQLSPGQGVVSVRSGQLRVRVGSLVTNVDPARSEVQIRLERGTAVRILGRDGTWLKIAPPEGVYLYVLDEFVDRISPEVAAQLRAEAAAKRIGSAAAPATRPVESQPVAAPDLSGAWGQRLVLVEAAIDAEARKPAMEQSWTAALAQLRPIVEQREEPMVSRLAREWITRLQQRIADLEALKAAQAIGQRDTRARTQFEREMEHLQRARQPASRPALAAVGLLRESLVLREQTARRYKLMDPLSGKVVAYLEFPHEVDLRVAEFVNKYVGVRGERRFEKSLGTDVIRVAEIEPVERAAAASRPARQNP